MSGRSADAVVDAMCGGLAKVADNAGVKSEKDSYDNDHDAVCRDVKITSGGFSSFFGCKYFPRGDSMNTMLSTWAAEGFQVVACPNFGGMLDSWPTFVLEKQGNVPPQMFLSVKDENFPGKVGIVGPGVASDPSLVRELLEVFQNLCGGDVIQSQDPYDKTYDVAFRNTRLTSGHATFTFAKPYWPHGYIVELMLQVFLKKGWRAVGGPNFGDDGQTWPGLIFVKVASE